MFFRIQKGLQKTAIYKDGGEWWNRSAGSNLFFSLVAFLRCIVNAIHKIKKFKHSESVLQQYSFF